jgi:hypothetical protein
MNIIKDFIDKMIKIIRKCNNIGENSLDITNKEKEFLSKYLSPNLDEITISNFRILLKTYKIVLAGSPIAKAWNWVTTLFSKYFSKKLQLLIKNIFSFFIRNTKVFIQKIEMFK